MLPDYIGPAAFGVKLPVIQPGDNISDLVYSSLEKCAKDNLLENNSIVCITESIVARAQNNYVTLDDVAQDVTKKLNLKKNSGVGVLFPIASRNRFSAILRGIARAVPEGVVYVQFPKDKDEVGNELVNHPATGMNYLEFYKDIIKKEGAGAFIIRSDYHGELNWGDLEGMIVSSIHNREKDLQKTKRYFKNSITLQDLCNEPKENSTGYSEWGLLGSNLSSNEKIKLAPRDSDKLVREVQKRVKEQLNKNVEVLVYGDGAYKDPSTGIYELADPVVAFGYTPGLECQRLGVKYKFIADEGFSQGKTKEQIEEMIKKEGGKLRNIDSMASEGTTPRPLKDIAGSLADLVSGSADAGTPLVIIRELMRM